MTLLEQEIAKLANTLARAAITVQTALEQAGSQEPLTPEQLEAEAEKKTLERERRTQVVESRHEHAVASIHARWKRY